MLFGLDDSYINIAQVCEENTAASLGAILV